MKHILTFERFLKESLEDRSEKDYDSNDWGYYLMQDKIENYLNSSAENIEELKDLPNFEEGSISTFSTAAKGNFVLNCGMADGKPACKAIDELNDIITYYVSK